MWAVRFIGTAIKAIVLIVFVGMIALAVLSEWPLRIRFDFVPELFYSWAGQVRGERYPNLLLVIIPGVPMVAAYALGEWLSDRW